MKFLLTVFPGLSEILAEELRQKLKLEPFAFGRVRGSELVFVQSTVPSGLLELRVVEDVFVELEAIKLSGKTSDLKTITTVLSRGETLGVAMGAHGLLTSRPVPVRAHFRVVVQAEDAGWRGYRRIDLQSAAEVGMARARPNWRLDPREAPIEIWLHQLDRNLHVSLRITSGLHRARGGRAQERQAALRPTIAAAMVLAAGTSEEDVILDPMCGSGTILLERALAGRHGLLLGGDIDPVAVKAALANFGPRHKPVRIERMDARKLPLEDSSVDKFVTNLPWGRQIGQPQELPELYTGVLKEAVRVLRPGGKVVLLSSEWELLKRVINQQPNLAIKRTVPNIEVLGRRADLILLERT